MSSSARWRVAGPRLARGHLPMHSLPRIRMAAALGVLTAATASGCGNSGHQTNTTATHASVAHGTPPRPPVLTARPLGRLATPEQDAAAAEVGGRVVLMGGLTAADTSRSDIVVLRNGREVAH